MTSGQIDRVFVYKYTQILRRHGHEVFIVTTRQKGAPPFETVDGIKVFRISSYSIPRIRYPIPNFPKLTTTIIQVVEKYRIDILEFNNHNYLTAIPLLFVRRRIKIPVAMSVDGLVGLTWVYGNKLIDFVALMYTFSVGKQLLKRADGFRLSNAALGQHLARLGIPQSKFQVVYNSIDRLVFHPGYERELKRDELGIKPEDRVVIYVGRLDPVKGVHYLLLAAKNILERKKNLKFLIVGDGSMRKTYEEMVSDFKENIIFTGLRRDVAALLNAADIMVLPSISEGCPNVVLEAAATATPIIASNVGGVPELLTHGETGFLVPPKNVKELETAIETLIDNPKMAKEMGQKAQAYVDQNFSVEQIGKRIEKYYSRVLLHSRFDMPASHLQKE